MEFALKIDRDAVAEFCRRWQIAELALFGSVLRDDFGPDSDVDVLVRFADDAPWSLFDMVTMQDELRELLGREVDIVEKDAIRNPFRRHTILAANKVIYAA